MTNRQHGKTAAGHSKPADAESVRKVFRKHWAQKIAKQEILFKAELSDEETWTFLAWLAPKKDRAPDFVFRTLLKNRQHAEGLMEMSLEDELSARKGLPRPYFDFRPGPAPEA